MKLIADLHIHSHFSRATSRNLTFEHLARWAQLKGIQIVGTGDIAHPGWLAEMREKLVPAEQGLYRLRDDLAAAVEQDVPLACRAPVRFILGGEISTIYKRDDRTRKVHNVVFTPSFAAAEKLQARLERIGNIRADGRPILGLDARDLLEILLETAPGCHLIPAHIWTPWFSLLGSKSGFDSVEACFADLTPHIFALETGLSSDPPMNWRVSALDRYALVSNSDAHSPEKLGREANQFDCELAYDALFDALRGRVESLPGGFDAAKGGLSDSRPASAEDEARNASSLQGTIEFFPEEGKYHFDGHRACRIAWDPPTTLAHNSLCAVCSKPVTVGVMHRVAELADRPEGGRPPHPRPFHSLIPLPEVLGEVYGVGDGSKQVQAEHAKLLARLGPELCILRDVSLVDIAQAGGERLAEGIGRMRRGEVVSQPGYDGEYGAIRVFGSARVSETQMGLFGNQEATGQEGRHRGPEAVSGEKETAGTDRGTRGRKAAVTAVGPGATSGEPKAMETVREDTASAPYATRHPSHGAALLAALNPEQRAAVLCTDRPLVIIAGPGTGKTRTLTVRIAYLILEQRIAPENVLAITFTNKAAEEMRERLEALLGVETARRVTVKTFHALGAQVLREHAAGLGIMPDFAILTDEERAVLLRQACPELGQAGVVAALAQISAAKALRFDPEPGTEGLLKQPGAPSHRSASAGLADQAALVTTGLADIPARYETALRAGNVVDFDDLILLPIRLFEERPDVLATIRARYRWISVDEYQDVNAAQYRLLRLLTMLNPGGAGALSGVQQSRSAPAERSSSVEAHPSPTSGEPMPDATPEARSEHEVNLCVIGDPDQAIFGFRGADSRYFLQFEQDYPGAVRLSLSKNYRSTQLILDAATQVIARRGKVFSPLDGETGGMGGATPHLQALADFADRVKVDVCGAPTDRAEAEHVVHQIEQMVGGTSYFSLDSGRTDGATPAAARSFAEFAVLYRLGAQSRLLVEAFERSGIPYQTAGQMPLNAHKAVREVLAYLWLLHNARSSAHREVMLAAGRGGSLPKGPARAIVWQELERTRQADRQVARLIEQAAALISQHGGKPPSAVDAERLSQLILRAVPFGDRLADFLEATALQSETDAYDPRADRVALMTLHAAKGLEFPVVFIVGCEEGLLPYQRREEPADVDEERRLCYVGLTRARHKLILTYARQRVLFGQFMENAASRFIGDIEAVLMELKETRHRSPEKKAESEQMSLF